MKRIISVVLSVILIMGCMYVTPVCAALTAQFTLNVDGPRANFTDYFYAKTGSKVLFNIPSSVYEVEYYRGNLEITDEAEFDIVAGTVALPVEEGRNVFTAKIIMGDSSVKSTKVEIYGYTYELVSSQNKNSDMMNVTDKNKKYISGTTQCNAETLSLAKALLEYDETNKTYGRDNVYYCMKSGIGGYTSHKNFEILEMSYDIFLVKEPVKGAIKLFGYMLSSNVSSETVRGTGYADAYNIPVGSTGLVLRGEDSGYSISTGEWHEVKCYYDTKSNAIDYYVDGVLLGKNMYKGTDTSLSDMSVCLYPPYTSSDNHTSIYYSNPKVSVYNHPSEETEQESMFGIESYKGENLKSPVDADTLLSEDSIIIECEDMNIINDNVVSVKESASASGGKFLRSYSAKSNTGSVPNPDIEYTAHFDKPGVYNVWIRVGVKGTESAIPVGGTAFYYSLNGGTSYSRCTITYSYATFEWRKLSTVSTNDNKIDICLAYRNREIAYDKIVITKDLGYKPLDKDEVPDGSTTAWYPMPDMAPPSGHPRIFVTTSTLEKLRKTASAPEMSIHMDMLEYRGGTTFMTEARCMPAGNSDHSATAIVAAGLRSRSLLYILGKKDTAYAQETIRLAKLYLAHAKWADGLVNRTRAVGNAMQAMAIVYDYHYDLLSEQEKQYFIGKLKQWAIDKETGYPPTGSSVFGHPCEAEVYRDLLSFGAAVYDEDPEVWNLAAGKFFGEMAPSKRFFSQSGNHPSGTKYASGIRTESEVLAALMFYNWGVSISELFGENFDEVPLRFIYSRLPYGKLINEGESSAELKPGWKNLSGMINIGKHIFKDSGYAPVYYGEWIKSRAKSDSSSYNEAFMEILTFDMYSDEESKTPYEIDFGSDLPLTRITGYPLTQMYARTSWQMGSDSPAAIAYVQAREITADTHIRPDIGTFQIYYKGYLTKTNFSDGGSGYLTNKTDRNYNRRTVAHSCMTVYDPEETFFSNYYHSTKPWVVLSNDGGHNTDNWFIKSNSSDIKTVNDVLNLEQIATNQGKYIGPNEKTPEFSYIKTDLTNSYGGRRINKTTGKTLKEDLIAKGYTMFPEEQIDKDVIDPIYFSDYEIKPKISDYKRSTVFLDLDNDVYPAAFVCFDKIDSTDATFEKNWLLQLPSEPTVSGNTTIVENTYTYSGGQNNGKMVVKTLLPESHDIEVIGGEGQWAWVDGVDYSLNKSSQDEDSSLDDDESIEEGASDEPKYGWRIEISPEEEAKEDLFLNAMYVTDADSTAAELPMTKVESGNFVGVTVLDRLVMFSKTAAAATQSFTITVPDNNNGGVMSNLITDVAPGMWEVVKSGSTPKYYEVIEEENALYFKGDPGTYTITPVQNATATQISYPEMEKNKIGDFIIYNKSDYMFRNQNYPTKIINDAPYVCVADFYPYYGSTVTENSDGSVTVSTPNSSGVAQVAKLTANKTSYTLNGSSKTLSRAPKLIDGKLYADPTTLTTAVPNLTIVYNSTKRVLRVTKNY